MKALVIIAIVFVLSISLIFGIDDAYGESDIESDEALLVVYSDTSWTGEYGREDATTTVSDQGSQFYKFFCKKGDSYFADFTKDYANGFLVLNIIQNGELLSYVSTEADRGRITLSSPCQTVNVSGDNNGFFHFTVNKENYEYSDIIRISGESRVSDKLEITIFDPSMNHIVTEKISVGPDGKFNHSERIKGSLWETNGTYTITVFYNEINKVKLQVTINQSLDENLQKQIIPTKIPNWVKNTMQWYIDGIISEDELLNAIKFLIKEGILVVD